jgi:hypothetical protein
MSETPESKIEPSTRQNRLRRALTWVGIFAGAVFIAGVIFVSGAATGWLPAWHDQHEQQTVSMPQGDPPMGPMMGDTCCCSKK